MLPLVFKALLYLKANQLFWDDDTIIFEAIWKAQANVQSVTNRNLCPVLYPRGNPAQNMHYNMKQTIYKYTKDDYSLPDCYKSKLY